MTIELDLDKSCLASYKHEHAENCICEGDGYVLGVDGRDILEFLARHRKQLAKILTLATLCLTLTGCFHCAARADNEHKNVGCAVTW